MLIHLLKNEKDQGNLIIGSLWCWNVVLHWTNAVQSFKIPIRERPLLYINANRKLMPGEKWPTCHQIIDLLRENAVIPVVFKVSFELLVSLIFSWIAFLFNLRVMLDWNSGMKAFPLGNLVSTNSKQGNWSLHQSPTTPFTMRETWCKPLWLLSDYRILGPVTECRLSMR